MRAQSLIGTIVTTTFFLIGSAVAASAMSVTETVQQAGQRAIDRIAVARRDGLPVDTAIELVAEHDSLCIVSFRVHDQRTVSILDSWCIEAEGAHETRRRGLAPSAVRAVERYIMQYPQRGDWDTLQRDLFLNKQRFVYVQHLVRHNNRARQQLLSVIVGHTASFIDPATREIKLK